MRRLIPSRCAIFRSEIPSAANARTCAHSNAFRTPHLSLDITDQSSLEDEADAISGAASGALFDCRSRCSIGLRASLEPVYATEGLAASLPASPF